MPASHMHLRHSQVLFPVDILIRTREHPVTGSTLGSLAVAFRRNEVSHEIPFV